MATIWQDLSTTIITYMKANGLDHVVRYLGSVSARERIQRDLIHRLNDDKFMSRLNRNRHLIGMKDGLVYDTNVGKLRKAFPYDYLSMSTNVIPGGNIDEEYNLMKILSEVFPQPDILRYFIRSCAMLLEGRNKDKLVYVWWGKGNNGKSMMEKLLSEALGNYATVCATSLITGKRTSADNASPQLSSMEGKLVVFLQEPNPNEVIRIGTVKELSGGDAITTRALFRSPRTFIPKFKLVIVCNNVMEIPSIDTAFRKRLVVIPFISTFYSKKDRKPGPYSYPMDTRIARDIGKYAKVFLRMMLDEYSRIKGSTDEIPDIIEQATDDYVAANNSPLMFIREQVSFDDEAEVPIDHLYREYKQWMMDNSSKRPVDYRVFYDEIINQGHEIVDRMVQGMTL